MSLEEGCKVEDEISEFLSIKKVDVSTILYAINHNEGFDTRKRILSLTLTRFSCSAS